MPSISVMPLKARFWPKVVSRELGIAADIVRARFTQRFKRRSSNRVDEASCLLPSHVGFRSGGFSATEKNVLEWMGLLFE
jgi:hypothetical protein